jgi:hypothetical protein
MPWLKSNVVNLSTPLKQNRIRLLGVGTNLVEKFRQDHRLLLFSLNNFGWTGWTPWTGTDNLDGSSRPVWQPVPGQADQRLSRPQGSGDKVAT